MNAPIPLPTTAAPQVAAPSPAPLPVTQPAAFDLAAYLATLRAGDTPNLDPSTRQAEMRARAAEEELRRARARIGFSAVDGIVEGAAIVGVGFLLATAFTGGK